MRIINNSKSIKQGEKYHNVLSQAEIKISVTSPILLLFLGLGLASQRGGRFDKSTNENAQKLYGYKGMSQPQLLVQTQV
jgi:hypothetical protein